MPTHTRSWKKIREQKITSVLETAHLYNLAWIRKKNPANAKSKREYQLVEGFEKKIQKKERISIPAMVHLYNMT